MISYVPSLISIGAFFIVSYCNRRLLGNCSQYGHAVKGLMVTKLLIYGNFPLTNVIVLDVYKGVPYKHPIYATVNDLYSSDPKVLA
jgi:hypothetical protein